MNSSKSHHKIKIVLLTLICLFLSMNANATTSETVTLRMIERSHIQNSNIFLKDICRLEGGTPSMVHKLENIRIAKAPLAGSSKIVHHDTVVTRLKQNNIDLSKVKMAATEQTVAVRETILVSTKQLEKIILDYLQNKLPWDADKVNIKNIRVENDIVLPEGKMSYQIEPMPKTDFLGKTTLSIGFSVNGEFIKKTWATLNIAVLSNVVVAKRPLGRYKVIQEEDLQVVPMDLAKIAPDAIRNMNEVIGKRTTRNLNAQTVMRPELIELPLLIKRGAIVSIIAESNSLKVVTLGKAKERGRKGQMIRVENLDSSKCIYARVLDGNSVMVEL